MAQSNKINELSKMISEFNRDEAEREQQMIELSIDTGHEIARDMMHYNPPGTDALGIMIGAFSGLAIGLMLRCWDYDSLISEIQQSKEIADDIMKDEVA